MVSSITKTNSGQKGLKVATPRGVPLTMRMLYGPLVAIVALIAVSVAFFGAEQWSGRQTDEALTRFADALEAERTFMQLSDGHAMLMRAAAQRGASGDRAEAMRLAGEGGANVANAISAIEQLPSFLERYRDRLQSYRVSAAHLQTVLGIEEFSMSLATADASAKFDALRRVIEQSSVTALERADDAREAAAKARSDAFLVTLGITLGAIFVSLLVSISVSRAVARPLSDMVDKVVALARGELDTLIPDTGRRDEVGALASALKVFRNDSRTLHHRAFHDQLTGLPNRAAFERELADRETAGAPFTAMLIDLDKFKDVNDTLGHDAGDLLLQQVAERFTALLPDDWRLARLGGDEFAIVAPGVGTPEAVLDTAWAIVHAAAETFDLDGQIVQIGASLGVACWPRHAADKRALLKNADLALYEAKEISRNTVAVFRPELTDGLERRRVLETKLRSQLADGAIEAWYEPTVDLKSGRPVAVEVVARLTGEDDRDVSAVELLEVAEESGLVKQLNATLLDKALGAMSDWPERVRLSLNISSLLLKNPSFGDELMMALDKHGISPNRLTLEVSEKAFWKAADKVEASMRRLRDNGVRFALDDFGVGSSCIRSLAELPFSEVKIDRSFVSSVGVGQARTGDSEGVIRTIVELARSLDLGVVALGVETEEHRRLLEFLGAERAQGALFGSPSTADELAVWLRNAQGGPKRVA